MESPLKQTWKNRRVWLSNADFGMSVGMRLVVSRDAELHVNALCHQLETRVVTWVACQSLSPACVPAFHTLAYDQSQGIVSIHFKHGFTY
jgi:hypothetical protein